MALRAKWSPLWKVISRQCKPDPSALNKDTGALTLSFRHKNSFQPQNLIHKASAECPHWKSCICKSARLLFDLLNISRNYTHTTLNDLATMRSLHRLFFSSLHKAPFKATHPVSFVKGNSAHSSRSQRPGQRPGLHPRHDKRSTLGCGTKHWDCLVPIITLVITSVLIRCSQFRFTAGKSNNETSGMPCSLHPPHLHLWSRRRRRNKWSSIHWGVCFPPSRLQTHLWSCFQCFQLPFWTNFE